MCSSVKQDWKGFPKPRPVKLQVLRTSWTCALNLVGAVNMKVVLCNERLTSTGQKSELAGSWTSHQTAQNSDFQGGAPASNFGLAFSLKPILGLGVNSCSVSVNLCYLSLCVMPMLSKMRGKFSLSWLLWRPAPGQENCWIEDLNMHPKKKKKEASRLLQWYFLRNSASSFN